MIDTGVQPKHEYACGRLAKDVTNPTMNIHLSALNANTISVVHIAMDDLNINDIQNAPKHPTAIKAGIYMGHPSFFVLWPASDEPL